VEKETRKLVNVLKRIARGAGYAAWMKSDSDAARFCAGQYNRVLGRISELEPHLNNLFSVLAEDASPEVTRIAARELVAYFEDEVPEPRGWALDWGFAQRVGRARGRCFPVTVRCD
jgi:hypothetical protein